MDNSAELKKSLDFTIETLKTIAMPHSENLDPLEAHKLNVSLANTALDILRDRGHR